MYDVKTLSQAFCTKKWIHSAIVSKLSCFRQHLKDLK